METPKISLTDYLHEIGASDDSHIASMLTHFTRSRLFNHARTFSEWEEFRGQCEESIEEAKSRPDRMQSRDW